MKDDLVNIEEAGFTPEDLENAGVELETTEETDTQEVISMSEIKDNDFVVFKKKIISFF